MINRSLPPNKGIDTRTVFRSQYRVVVSLSAIFAVLVTSFLVSQVVAIDYRFQTSAVEKFVNSEIWELAEGRTESFFGKVPAFLNEIDSPFAKIQIHTTRQDESFRSKAMDDFDANDCANYSGKIKPAILLAPCMSYMYEFMFSRTSEVPMLQFSWTSRTNTRAMFLTTLGTMLVLFVIGALIAQRITNRKMKWLLIDPISKVSNALREEKSLDQKQVIEKLERLSNEPAVSEVQDFLHALVSRTRSIENLEARERDLQVFQAIAQTVQMVAHDVRKPFSLLGSGIQIFKGAKTIDEIQQMLPHLESSLNSALTSVNGMLSDIMDVGRDLELEIEPSSIKSLVHQALEETCYVFSEAKVSISYKWGHIHMVKADPMKVRRAFSNILSNACQAMRARQPIWIETSEKGGKIEIVIGNHGSFIPEEDLPKLFQAFFTKRKKGKGTGLGLAIAKKIVEAHGGTIDARSDAEKQSVEFLITLPIDSAEDHLHGQELPSRLSDFSKLKSIAEKPVDDLGSNDDRINRRTRIKEHVAKTNQRLCVAILDDEEFYRTLVVKLSEHHDLSSLITFQEFSSPNDLLSADLEKIDFIISDVDLRAEMNGYDVTEKIRSMDLGIPICIHSNKALSQDYEKAIKSGATTFMPKPMTIDHFLRFLTDCISD